MDREIRMLAPWEHGRTRGLWEEVFSQDSKEFLDYYYEEVAGGNTIFADEEQGEIVSMLHLNPYCMYMGQEKVNAHYIVAVATKERYRHQGRMKRLLEEAMHYMYGKREPFTFLMPAAEAIYRPFGFLTVYRQDMMAQGAIRMARDNAGCSLKCRSAENVSSEELALLANRIRSAFASVYTARTGQYFQRIMKEQECMGGEILLFYQGERLAGYCFTGTEDGAEAWEIAVTPEDEGGSGDAQAKINAAAVEALTRWFDEKGQLPVKISGFLPGTEICGIRPRERSYRPMMMARIIHLRDFVAKMHSAQNVEFVLEVTDDILEENNGKYRFVITPAGGKMEAAETADGKITIEELTGVFFGVLESPVIPAGKLQILTPFYVNELV